MSRRGRRREPGRVRKTVEVLVSGLFGVAVVVVVLALVQHGSTTPTPPAPYPTDSYPVGGSAGGVANAAAASSSPSPPIGPSPPLSAAPAPSVHQGATEAQVTARRAGMSV